MNIFFTIQHKMKKLPKAEQKLAAWILDHSEEVIHMSAKALAEAVHTSPATVVRLCYSLGIEGFTDLKLRLSANLPEIKGDLYSDIAPDENVATIKRKLMLKVTDAIEKNAEILVDTAVAKTVDLIEASDIIFCFGIGASGIVADDFFQKFLRIGKQSIYNKDQHLLTTALLTNDVSAMLLLVSNSGEKREVLQLGLTAKDQKIPIVGMTSKAQSTLAGLSDIVIHTADGGEAPLRSSATNSLLVQLYTVDVIFSSYASRHYDKTIKQLEQTKLAAKRIGEN